MLQEVNGQLCLMDPEKKRAPLCVRYDAGPFAHRLQQPIGTELLARAVRLKHVKQQVIWDLTAGLGYDGVRMASMGHHVTLVERHPIFFEMIQHALKALPESTLQNVTLINNDAMHWCDKQKEKPHVIYLDPMFPARHKSALVSNEAQWLQALADSEDNSMDLLDLALQHATHRVVIKRPRLAPAIPHKHHVGAIIGKQCRFDLVQPQ